MLPELLQRVIDGRIRAGRYRKAACNSREFVIVQLYGFELYKLLHISLLVSVS